MVPTCVVYCWYMPGPICCVTTFCLQLHLRVPGAGFHTLLSRVTCGWGCGTATSAAAQSSCTINTARAGAKLPHILVTRDLADAGSEKGRALDKVPVASSSCYRYKT